MKKIFISAALVASAAAFAQTTGKVGVNTATPAATLEITPNAANAGATATTNEGILIPRLTTARVTAITAANRVEGTMVYVTDAPSGTLFSDTTKGFYYWDPAANTTGQWVKMGSGSSAGANLAPAKGTIRTVANITSAQWTANDFTIVITDGTTNLQLPDPTANTGRIISVRNASSAAKSYNGSWVPTNNSSLGLNRGNILQSDGTQWWNISSF